MKITTLSEIGKGPLFKHIGLMGPSDGITAMDENWVRLKEENIVNKIKSGATNLSSKGATFKSKMEIGVNKLKQGDIDIKTKIFNNNSRGVKMQSDNDKANMLMGRNNDKGRSLSYFEKVEMIMGNSKKSSRSNWDTKVKMIMGGTQKSKNTFPDVSSYLGMSQTKKPSIPNVDKFFKTPAQPKKVAVPEFGKFFNAPTKQATPNIPNVDAYFSGIKTPQSPVVNKINAMLGNNSVNPQDKLHSLIGNVKGFDVGKIISRVPETNAWNRVEQQKGLDMWGDKDKDMVANILDCNPLDPNQQGWVHDLKNRAVNIVKYGKNTKAEFTDVQPPETVKQKFISLKEKTVPKVQQIKQGVVNVVKYGSTKYGSAQYMPGQEPETVSQRFSNWKKKREEEKQKKAVLEAQRKAEIEAVGFAGEKKTEMIKAQAKADLDKAEAQSKLIRARADIIRAQKATSSSVKKGKGGKEKVTDVYREEYSPTTSGTVAYGIDRSLGGISGFLRGGQSMFGGVPMGGGYVSPSMGVGATGRGIYEMSRLVGSSAGVGMQSSLGGQGDMKFFNEPPKRGLAAGLGDNFSQYSRSGQGFLQMLGVKPVQQQTPMQTETEEEEYEEEPEVSSGQIKEFGGIRYIRTPDGKWKNLKSGDTVRYPRGSYGS